MALVSEDGLVAAMATSQQIPLNRQGARTTISGAWFQTLDLAGQPGAGVLAGTNTANGIVPDDSTAGCPKINNFTGSNTGYLLNIHFGNTLPCRLRLADMLFKAGPYAFNATTTLASQPSYSGRLPLSGGTPDYKGTELWIECVVAFTGIPSIAITYTNQDGVAGRTTGTVSMGSALTVGRMIQLPLQAGDTGIQKVESVTATVATVGTFNVLVLRPLWSGRVHAFSGAGGGNSHSPDFMAMPIVPNRAALIVQALMDSTAMGIFETLFNIING